MKYGLFSTMQSLFGYDRLVVEDSVKLLQLARGPANAYEGHIVPAEFLCFFEIADKIRAETISANKLHGTHYEAMSPREPLTELAEALVDFTSNQESQYAIFGGTPKSNEDITTIIAKLKDTYNSPEETELFNRLASITSNTSVNFAADIACR